MKNIVVICGCILSLNAWSTDLLDVLNDKKDSKTIVDGQKPEERGIDFSDLVSTRTPEQNIFFSFLNKAQFKKALFQWDAAFAGHPFSRSENGIATLGLLKYSVGLKVNGIETLMTISTPDKLDARVAQLWRDQLISEKSLWDYADLQWRQGWSGFIPIEGEVKIRLKTEASMAPDQLKEIYRKLGSENEQHVAIIWHLIIELADSGEEIDAAKLLKKLLNIDQQILDVNLIYLTIGRILYQKGYLDASIDYYEKIPKKSQYWFVAREEQGWAFLRKAEPQNAMAISKTLVNDSFLGEVGPEAHYLQALAQLKVCDYSEVVKTLNTFKAHFRPRAEMLMSLKKSPKNENSQKAVRLTGDLPAKNIRLGALVKQLPVGLAGDQTFRYRIRRMNFLNNEAADAEKLFHESMSESSDSIGFQGKFDHLKNKLVQRAQLSENLVYERIRELADDEMQSLKQVLHKMQIVEAELVQQLALAEQLIKDKSLKAKDLKGTSSGDKYALKFPYESELWFDELNNYKIDIKGGCQAKKSL